MRWNSVAENLIGTAIIFGGMAIMFSVDIRAEARKPAVVDALHQKAPVATEAKVCKEDLVIAKRALETELHEANKRISRLRGALGHMTASMRRISSRGNPGCWNAGANVHDTPMIDLYNTASNALSVDDGYLMPAPEMAK